jgi:adenine-specific DNA-methyltransferase
MDGKSSDIAQDKLNKLKELFPEIFVEGKVDVDKLKLTIGENLNINNERYVLNWAGKADAFKILQTPTTATLVPAPEESIDFNKTNNVFIEGENLDVLKVLQKSYYGKVKMIYIDPPYNTGNDSFIYPDRFYESKEDYLKRIGEKDEEGYLLKEGVFRKNSKENGQFHSNWLSMIYPRLFLARNLLSEDGVILVSIDDNEVHNLRILMNEIFGEESFVAVFPWRKRTAKSDVPFGVSQDYEWILMFAKGNFNAGNAIERKYYQSADYKDGWRLSDLTTQRSKEERPNSFFTLINPKNGEKYEPNPNRVWGITKETFKGYFDKGKIVFPGDYEFLKISKPAFRVFESEDRKKNIKKFDSEDALMAVSTLLPKEIGRTEDGTKEITELFEAKIFPFPKPSTLIKHFISMLPNNDFTVLDFFSGSCTTAQAVLECNKNDDGTRRFICIQLPEKTGDNSDAFKAGYKTIAEIGKERIRRVINKIRNENKIIKNAPLEKEIDVDLGFKVFKLKTSNFKIWRSDLVENEDELSKQLDAFENPVKPEVENTNMMWEILLKSGYDFNTRIEEKQTNGCSYYSIKENELIVVLDAISGVLITAIVKSKPQKCICLDRLFAGNDQLKTNTVLQMKDAGIEFKTI